MSDQENTQDSLFGSDTAEVQPLPPVEAPKPKRAGKAAGNQPVPTPSGERMFTIVLEESDEIPPTGQFVGVNGRSWIIRPGEEVTVPECVLEALNDARSSVPRTDSAGNIVDYRDKQRLPYRLVRAS